MNKDVIKKYRDVFDYWLDGGKVLEKSPDFEGWFTMKESIAFQCTNTVYVQDDEYAELRKAQADGKTILFISRVLCKEVEMCGTDFTQPIGDYRIKPDEPKFKVGQWMINTKTEASGGREQSSPLLVTQDWLDHIEQYGVTWRGNTSYTGDLENFELWQPQDGEYVACWNAEGVYCVGKYTDGLIEGITWKNIAPLEFITTLKDK